MEIVFFFFLFKGNQTYMLCVCGTEIKTVYPVGLMSTPEEDIFFLLSILYVIERCFVDFRKNICCFFLCWVYIFLKCIPDFTPR